MAVASNSSHERPEHQEHQESNNVLARLTRLLNKFLDEKTDELEEQVDRQEANDVLERLSILMQRIESNKREGENIDNLDVTDHSSDGDLPSSLPASWIKYLYAHPDGASRAAEAMRAWRETILLRYIRSHPFERSTKGTTLCSKTARLNARDIFGVRVPQAHAKAAVESPPIQGEQKKGTYQETLDYRSDGGTSFASMQAYLRYLHAEKWVNMCDMLVQSRSPYGHRIILFKSETDGQRYVLDPYRSNDLTPNNTDPKPADEYFARDGNKPIMLRCYAAPKRVA